MDMVSTTLMGGIGSALFPFCELGAHTLAVMTCLTLIIIETLYLHSEAFKKHDCIESVPVRLSFCHFATADKFGPAASCL